MLVPIQNLPEGIEGLIAHGTVERAEYDTVVQPLLERAARDDEALRLLCVFAPDFEGVSAGAAWADLKSLGLVDDAVARCAVVADDRWVGLFTEAVSALPGIDVRMKRFDPTDMERAVGWLTRE